MREVADAFANREHALIEAPPGIGKTIGYLIPAALLPRNQKAGHNQHVFDAFTAADSHKGFADCPRSVSISGNSGDFKRAIALFMPV